MKDKIIGKIALGLLATIGLIQLILIIIERTK